MEMSSPAPTRPSLQECIRPQHMQNSTKSNESAPGDNNYSRIKKNARQNSLPHPIHSEYLNENASTKPELHTERAERNGPYSSVGAVGGKRKPFSLLTSRVAQLSAATRKRQDEKG